MHGKDFGMEAKHHFFVKSHGTNLCSGVAGAVNRFAAHPSLPREVQNQIFNSYQIYSFAKSGIHNITCFSVDKYQIEVILKVLFYRFEMTKNIKTNWRQYFNLQNFRGRCCSNIFDSPATLSIAEVTPEKFCACYFEKDWYFGIVNYVSTENSNANIKYLHPKGPVSKYFWSSNADVCWILNENVAYEENPPVGQDFTSQICTRACSKYGFGLFLAKKQHLTWLDLLI